MSPAFHCCKVCSAPFFYYRTHTWSTAIARNISPHCSYVHACSKPPTKAHLPHTYTLTPSNLFDTRRRKGVRSPIMGFDGCQSAYSPSYAYVGVETKVPRAGGCGYVWRTQKPGSPRVSPRGQIEKGERSQRCDR